MDTITEVPVFVTADVSVVGREHVYAEAKMNVNDVQISENHTLTSRHSLLQSDYRDELVGGPEETPEEIAVYDSIIRILCN